MIDGLGPAFIGVTSVTDPADPPATKEVKVALVDAQGVYQGMIDPEAPEAAAAIEAGGKLLLQVTECDLTPGKSRWLDFPENAMGGTFFAIPPEQQPTPTPSGVTAEQAIALFMLRALERDPSSVPPKCVDWLNHVVRTVDFLTLATDPTLASFVSAQTPPE